MHGTKLPRGTLTGFGVMLTIVVQFFIGSVRPAYAAFPAIIPAGQIVGQCVGWPSPHIEIRWSATPPPGSLAPNSNSVLRSVDGGNNSWFFGGGYPGVTGTRIDGSSASPVGPGGYPNPNFAVYDLRDNGALIGHTYRYYAKYRPETPTSNTYTVTVSAANCGGAGPVSAVSISVDPTTVVPGDPVMLSWSSSNVTSCVATGAWSGSKATVGSQRVSSVTVQSTFGLTCHDGSGPVSAEVTVAVGSLPPPASGTISGVCRWNGGSPRIDLVWSQYPPPGQGVANSNGLQKGDSVPNDPNQYWGFLPNNPNLYTYTDAAVTLNTQYQYRVKYRPDLPSTNTYNIYVSAETCGGPPPAVGPLSIFPTFQNVPPNVTAVLSASGGDGTYTWEAPDGIITGTGSQVGVTFTNNSIASVLKSVTVHSAGQTAVASVRVDGIQTLQDSIDLIGQGTRYVIINNNDAYVYTPQVTLTLAHGFPGQLDSSVKVKLANTQAGLSTAPEQPFQTQIPWNICTGLTTCTDGFYSVYAVFISSAGVQSPTVVDSIAYIVPELSPGTSRVVINDDAPTTADRSVALELHHGFIGIPDDEIFMRIANKPELVDGAAGLLYGLALPAWDLCDGYGSTCPNGPHTVYVKFCARGSCQPVVHDDINLQSPWPDWGVKINNDATMTSSRNVQLSLNPFFDRPGTVVLISNLPNLSDAVSHSFSVSTAWDLCAGLPACGPATFAVYVRYVNPNVSWPSPRSPRYQDDIGLSGATPLPLGPAAILINDDAPTTISRFVGLKLFSPLGGGPTVSMRVVNDNALSQRDIDIIKKAGGGITKSGTRNLQVVMGDVVAPSTPELESGTVRPFSNSIKGWDLCQDSVPCPFGVHRVYVQYYKTPATAAVTGTLAAVGDLVSAIYYDDITYALPTPTPTPTPTLTPVPTASVEPSPTGGPVTSGEPGIPGAGSPGGGLISAIQSFFQPLIEALSGAQGVITPISMVSTLIVVASAVAALAPLIGPGLIAFSYQWFMSVLGLLPKRKKVWGTVYDSNTKRPISFAKVQLIDRNRRVLETHIADKEGRYGFLTTPESVMAQNLQIAIVASHDGYVFPSRTPASIDTFVYNNLYYGDLIEVNEKTLINFDIPMDPVKASRAPLLLKSPSIALGATVAAVADAGFWLGLLLVPLNFLLTPNPLTFGVLCVFLGTASLRVFGISEHPYGIVKDSQTSRPMSFALITLNDMTGKRVGFTVSDERGRYFIVAEKGTYEVTVFTPATVTPPRQQKMVIQAKKGWITRELRI